MDDIFARVKASGGIGPRSIPHICPYRRKDGASKEMCESLTEIVPRNREGCCGAAELPPCNCYLRKCIICLEMGRRGSKANTVTDVANGWCSEHVDGIVKEQLSLKRVLTPPRLPRKSAIELIRAAAEIQKRSTAPPLPAESIVKPLSAVQVSNRTNKHVPIPPFKKRDGAPDWRDVAARYKAAKAGQAKMPKLRDISDAIAEMKLKGMDAKKIGAEFGLLGPSTPNFVSHIYGLQRLTDEVWNLIAVWEKRGEIVPYNAVYLRLSRFSADEQLKRARRMFPPL